MSDRMRAVIDTLIPPGSAWEVAPGEDWDKFYDGMAENWESPRAFLAELSEIRNPALTPFLDDLEQEFGVLTNPNLTAQQRRDQLTPIVFNRSSNGGLDNLQTALDDAGFTVQVHSNSPAVDPAIFLDQVFQMVAGGLNAVAGNQDAFAGRLGGELLVNGDIFETTRLYESVAGTMFAGTAGAGEYSDLERTKIEYPIPGDPDSWPLIFFVGGDATRGGGGELTDIELADVPAEQEQEFKRIILKFKPMHSWAGLVINFA